MNEGTTSMNADQQADAPDRRGFLKLTLGAVGACYAAAIGYPIYRYLGSPAEQAAAMSAIKEVSLASADQLPAGSAMMFKFGTRPAMLIHHADGTWAAYDAVCTHLGCTVQFEGSKNLITCACHGGVYDATTGRNIGGPPPRPLKSYQITIETGSVLVSRT